MTSPLANSRTSSYASADALSTCGICVTDGLDSQHALTPPMQLHDDSHNELQVSAEGCGGSFRHSLCWPLLLIHQGGLTAACCCKISGLSHISVGRKHAGSFVTDECTLCRRSYPLGV